LIAWRLRTLALTLAPALVACERDDTARTHAASVGRAWSAPAADVGVACSDVGLLRVCWDEQGRPSVVERTLPPRAAPTRLGFRCQGQGGARTCEARDDVGPFACDGATCVQHAPRQPDDGQWQCTDDSAATVCIGAEPPAGVAETAVASGWVCGTRKRAPPRDPPDRRVCVDLSPDFPGGSPAGQRCRWSYERGPTRTCTLDPREHALGDPCDAKAPCVVGALCVSGRCVPPRPRPECAFDSDCNGDACRFGSCAGSGR
jgi:hypothetical protein